MLRKKESVSRKDLNGMEVLLNGSRWARDYLVLVDKYLRKMVVYRCLVWIAGMRNKWIVASSYV